MRTRLRLIAALIVLLVGALPLAEPMIALAGPRSAQAGGKRPVAYLDIEDPYTTRKPLDGCLKRLGVAAERLKPTGSFVSGGARVLLIGSFATGNSKGRRFIRENARRIRDFILAGGVVIEFGQSSADESSPPWLPDGLVAQRCARDCTTSVVLDGKHPLMDGEKRVDMAALMGGEVFRGARYYAPSILGGTDLFYRVEGLNAVVAERRSGEFPLVLAGPAGKGGVILLAASPDLLCDSGTPETARAEAEDMMRNLLAVALESRFSEGGVPARSIAVGRARSRVTVYHDRDGDGRRDPGEEGLPDSVVTYDFEDRRTDGDGRAEIEVDPLNPGLVFVRIPDGWDGKRWYADAAGPGPFEFGLQPLASKGRLGATVLQLTDTHLGRIDLAEDARMLEQFVGELGRRVTGASTPETATGGTGGAKLFAFTGDLTHTGSMAELKAFRAALVELQGPGMYVMGNHDWGSGPDKGRLFRHVLGPSHFTREWQGYLLVSVPRIETHPRARSWLEQTVASSRLPVLFLVHYFPTRPGFDSLQSGRVTGVLSGHWHGDMVSVRNGVVNINSPPSLMGGWDFSPGSARVVRLDEGGISRADLVPMRRTLGAGGKAGENGAGGKAGERASCLPTWASSVPGRVLLASPLVAGERLLVPFRSAGTVGGDGGICAFSRASGSTEWCLSTPTGVANDLAVSGKTVLVAEVDGSLQGVDVTDGSVRWRTRLDGSVEARYVEHYVHSGAAMKKGVAYFCYQGGPFGVDAGSGRIVWTAEAYGGLDAFAHARGVVIGDYLYCGAFLGGVYRFRLGGAGPGRRERLIEGNVTADLSTRGGLSVLTRDALLELNPLTGKVESSARIDYAILPAGIAWGDFGPFVPDGSRGLRRLGARNGGKAWKVALGQGELSFALNLRDSSGPIGSPVALGKKLVVPGADGLLRILAARTGEESVRFDAGGPLVSTPAIHSGTAYVATYFGKVLAVPLASD